MSLPVVARREDTLHQAHFGRWLIRHIDSWFAFSQWHGMGIQMEDIILVTGCHRTRSRSNIVFYDSQVDSRVSLRVQTPGIGTTVHWQVLSQRIQGAMLSHGPSGEVRAYRLQLLMVTDKLRCVFSELTTESMPVYPRISCQTSFRDTSAAAPCSGGTSARSRPRAGDGTSSDP